MNHNGFTNGLWQSRFSTNHTTTQKAVKLRTAHVLESVQHAVDRAAVSPVYSATVEILVHHMHPGATGQSLNGHIKKGRD